MCRSLLPAVVVAVAACGGDPVPMSQSQITSIDIYDFYYSPTSVTVRAGTTVEWSNRGPSAHTATSDDGVWDSGTIAPPSSGNPPPATPPPAPPPPPPTPYPYPSGLHAVVSTFSTTLNTPGVYAFHCSLHPPGTKPGFVGTITVTE